MFKRKALDLSEDLLQGEQSVHDAILKLSAARNKANSHHLRWASAEDNSLILSLFKRLAEIQWMYNEATKQMAVKHLRLSKMYKQLFQEEKLMEEVKKDLQSSSGRLSKLQKQIDVASKRGDHLKKQSLEAELITQTSLCDAQAVSADAKVQKHEQYKVTQLKKALVCQAEGVITLSGHCQQLYASQMQLIDLLPDTPVEGLDATTEVDHCMTDVVSKVSNLLDLHPPPHGGLDFNTESADKNHLSLGVLLKRHRSAESIEGGEPKSPSSSKEEEIVRPMVNYTKGMYCEIVIPDPNSASPVRTVHRDNDNSAIPMRRSQSSSSPATHRKLMQEKRRSEALLDRDGETNDVLSGAAIPLDTDSEISIPDTSSEDLPCPDEGYSQITILTPSPPAKSASPTSPSVNGNSEYAKPADVVPFDPLNYNWDQQRRGRRKVPSPPIPEKKTVSPYETVEDIRKLKKAQQNDHKNQKTPEKLEQSDEHIYSKPFDALPNCNGPLKVSTELTKNQASLVPPVVPQRPNGGRYPNEKAVKSLHQTNGRLAAEESKPQPNNSRYIKGRSFSAKKHKVTSSPATSKPDTKAPSHFVAELEHKLLSDNHQNDKDDNGSMFLARSGSAGSIRKMANPPRTGVKTKLSTGTVINGPDKKPLPAPRYKQ